MGCCGRNKKKKVKSKTDVTNTIKRNKIEKKSNVIEENPILKIEPVVKQEPTPIVEDSIQVISTVERRTKSPLPDYDIDDFIDNISPTENISSVKTWHDLEKSVEKNEKSVSIVLFYGRYCPYSKRTMPSLRQWARMNKDRIFLYEADVEQAANLAEYYHIRSIPTIMAFEEKNLLAPIWQRTANNVLPSSTDASELMEEEEEEEQFDNPNQLYVVLDPSVQKSDRIEPSKETKPEQYLLILDQKTTSEEEEKTIDESHSLANIPSKSVTSSLQSSYIWNQSTQSLETNSEKSLVEYNGRMISQSTLTNTDQSKKKRTWDEYLDDNFKPKEYPQHIHLPNSNEIFYEKQFDNTNDFNPSLSSSDRFSTLTYQHVQELNHPHEEICILYLGPHGSRGFEDNLPEKLPHPTKLSLVTLHSN